MGATDHAGAAFLDAGAAQATAALALAGQALELAGLAAAAAGYAAASKAPNTRKAYGGDWQSFTAFCARIGAQALPAEPSTVCLYLTAHAAEHRVSTLRRRLSSINLAHQAHGHPAPSLAPSVKSVFAGIARMNTRPVVRKTPLLVEAMRLVLDELDDSARGRRDRAMLLVGWAGALRRSEIVALNRADVRLERRGLVLTLRRGKTDQLGLGREVAIPHGARPEYDPVAAWSCWAELLRDRQPPAFRAVGQDGRVTAQRLADKHVARLVKRVCALAGLDGDYSGHSLRAGLATSAAAAGASERAIMNQTGHRSVVIARQYIRPATLFEDNAAAVAAL